MKLNFIKLLLALFFISGASMPAQSSKTGAVSRREYPASFTITKAEFDQLMAKKTKETVSSKSSKYLNKASVLMNTLNGDTRFMKLGLSYFSNAFLLVQVNGIYSTQVFILSDDKSVFYKGRPDHGSFIMTKCNEDDIVSE